MKKFLKIISVIGMIALISCKTSSKKEIVEQSQAIGSIQRVDSLDFALNGKYIENSSSIFQLQKIASSNPNSAGGVDVSIIWKNVSTQIIKYVTFQVVPKNAVDDIVVSEISRDSIEYLSVTGPVSPGKVYGKGKNWQNVWYNHTIERCVLRKVVVEFMGGEKFWFKITEKQIANANFNSICNEAAKSVKTVDLEKGKRKAYTFQKNNTEIIESIEDRETEMVINLKDGKTLWLYYHDSHYEVSNAIEATFKSLLIESGFKPKVSKYDE